MARALAIVFVAIGVGVLAGAAIFYMTVFPGLSSARNTPSELEVEIASWLLRRNVPGEAREAVNPLADDPASAAAGGHIFREKCKICHSYDGSGRTEIGSGQFPRVPAFHETTLSSMSDGEIFYNIKNEIRNTGMPAWDMPDDQIWQLVSYIRDLPIVAPTAYEEIVAAQVEAAFDAQYVGSAACQECHQATYENWSTTRMANVVRDPREHPDAIH